ncbi:MAG: type III pantothenate kinase [Bradymonadales bacterium]|jgi:type III pantothenate kinase
MRQVLCLDIGNSSLVAARYKGKQQLARVDMGLDAIYENDEYMFSALAALANGVKDCVYSSVSPRASNLLEALMHAFSELRFSALTLAASGIKSTYQSAERLGSDRVANALAAYSRFKGACIVVDMGTATHFDVVDKDGSFLGGPIAPGLFSSMRIFRDVATHLSDFRVDGPIMPIANNTLEALNAGAQLFSIGGVEFSVAKIRQELACEATCILTGGGAKILGSKLECIDCYWPDLTLDGLALFAERYLGKL